MKVLDLHCQQQHVFEGWFGSEDDFQSQLQRKLVQCPVCGDSSITKRLSAPRLNLGAQPPRQPAAVSAEAKPATARAPAEAATQIATSEPVTAAAVPELTGEARAQLHAMQAAWMQWSRKVAENTEDVGKHFAEEARRIHYGETDERAIRGQASPEQAMELMDEGIGVMPLALPEASNEGSGSLQ